MRGDEINQLTKERLIDVLCVVLLRSCLVSNTEVKRDQLQALTLNAGDNFADQTAGNAVRLDQNKSTFSHGEHHTMTNPAAPEWWCSGVKVATTSAGDLRVLGGQQTALHTLDEVLPQVQNVGPH